ncbi:MAG TPA: hypothetical protein VJ769_08010 [Actinomycetes bacterium]|nr:hypothetical protein [Actinomycetes bacterium]
MSTATLPRVTFETTDCTRCGGTGAFGPLAVEAGRCFKCRGGKRQLTRAGAAARKAFEAVTDQMSRPVGEIAVSDKVKLSKGWGIVSETGRGQVKYKDGDNWVESVDVRFSNSKTIMCYQPTATAKVWSDEIYLAAAERVRKLKGATVAEREPVEAE